MRSQGREKERNCRQFRLWKKWRRERFETLLTGTYAEPTSALLAFFKTGPDPAALVAFVKSGPWTDADADVRFEILSLLDAMIIKRRERMNMQPFDDRLPDRPSNIFLLLREYLFPLDGGATRGGARLQATSVNEKESTNE